MAVAPRTVELRVTYRADIWAWLNANRGIIGFLAVLFVVATLMVFAANRFFSIDPVVSESIQTGQIVSHHDIPGGRFSPAYQAVLVSLPDGNSAMVEVPFGFDGDEGQPISLRRLVQESGRISYQYNSE